jgi:hypothetical protein
MAVFIVDNAAGYTFKECTSQLRDFKNQESKMKKVSVKKKVDFSKKNDVPPTKADAKKTAANTKKNTLLPNDQSALVNNLSGKEIILTPLFDHIGTAVFIVDINLNLVDANKYFCSI